jgi:hypothetical protein
LEDFMSPKRGERKERRKLRKISKGLKIERPLLMRLERNGRMKTLEHFKSIKPMKKNSRMEDNQNLKRAKTHQRSQFSMRNSSFITGMKSILQSKFLMKFMTMSITTGSLPLRRRKISSLTMLLLDRKNLQPFRQHLQKRLRVARKSEK